MSDQFHNYDDYEEVNDESEKFTQGIHLHNQFKKSVGFADEFLRKKLRRRKIYRYTSLAAIILLLLVAGYMSYKYYLFTGEPDGPKTKTDSVQKTTPTKPIEIIADKVLDIIVCEKMEAPDASKASDALIKEFGDKFNANIYSGSGVKSISVSANLKAELYTALCNNTAAVAPEALSSLLKQMIYSPKDAKLPSNMVVLNNLTDITQIIKRDKEAQLINIKDIEFIDKYYNFVFFILINEQMEITTQAVSRIDINTDKINIRNY